MRPRERGLTDKYRLEFLSVSSWRPLPVVVSKNPQNHEEWPRWRWEPNFLPSGALALWMQREHRSRPECTTPICGAVQEAIHIDQRRIRLRAVSSAGKTVEHFLRARRGYAKDGTVAALRCCCSRAPVPERRLRAADKVAGGRTIKLAFNVYQRSSRIQTVGAAGEAVQHVFYATRADAVNGTA